MNSQMKICFQLYKSIKLRFLILERKRSVAFYAVEGLKFAEKELGNFYATLISSMQLGDGLQHLLEGVHTVSLDLIHCGT